MRIALKRLTEGINHLQIAVPSEALDLEAPELRCASEIKAELTIARSEWVYSIKGSAFGSARLVCARCLTEFETELSAPLELIVQRQKMAPAEDAGDEVKFISPDADFVDLTDEVRDALLLAFPIKALCSEGCRGLCPFCGEDLNEGICTCQQARTDVRWNKLLALKDHIEA